MAQHNQLQRRCGQPPVFRDGSTRRVARVEMHHFSGAVSLLRQQVRLQQSGRELSRLEFLFGTNTQLQNPHLNHHSRHLPDSLRITRLGLNFIVAFHSQGCHFKFEKNTYFRLDNCPRIFTRPLPFFQIC